MRVLIRSLYNKICFMIAAILIATGAHAADSPNILFIAIDDLNDWVEGYDGHPDARTPNIVKLAARGVSFTNAHAPSNTCNPSRTAVLTGLSPHRTGVLRNSHYPFRSQAGQDVQTIFQHFQSNGYYVAGAGKLFHRDSTLEPWSEYALYERPREAPAGYPLNGLHELIALGSSFDWGPIGGRLKGWHDFDIATFGSKFLERNHTNPFFLAIGFYLPHLPWYVPEKFWDKITEAPALPPYLPNDLDDVAANRRTPRPFHSLIVDGGQWHEAIRAYLAATTFVDAQIGRLMRALDASPYVDNTIIVLWSDHGFHLGEKDHWQKNTHWEESTRVPFIIVAPNVSPPDTRVSHVVSLLDLYPTLVELAGIEYKSGLDGFSLASFVANPNAGVRGSNFVVTSKATGDALRSKRWRYIKYSNGQEELYDHRDDPNEYVNLAGSEEYAAIKTKLKRRLERAISF